MLNFILRPAELDDLPRCLEIDASYVTSYVWQMEERFENPDTYGDFAPTEANPRPRPKILGKSPSPTPDEYRVSFRPSRLPRPLAVPPRMNEQSLLNEWKKTDYLLVAESIPGEADLGMPGSLPQPPGEPVFPNPELIGYIGLRLDRERHLAWISSGGVQINYRRKGVGHKLWQEARMWADRNRLRSILVELDTKNYPAIQFFQKHNFFFCGYNSAYYPNREIAVFLGCRLEPIIQP